jgi:manganese transport protein
MEGYLQLRINPLLRRLITRLLAIIPAVAVILIYGDDKVDYLLILSQVILSLQLGFAIIPLIHFVSDKETMGEFSIKPFTKILSWIVAAILIFLNVKMVTEQSIPVFEEDGNLFYKIILIVTAIVFTWLFLMMTFLPLVRRRKKKANIRIHSEERLLENLIIPETQVIAVALDFSNNDERLIAYALSQGKQHASYVLMHVVETVSAKYFGDSADDDETRKDQHRLELYASQLKNLNYKVSIEMGYKNRIKEIVRIVKNTKADLLIMGAHHHTGLKDFLYGATVDQVRHKLAIPVLIVN